MKRNMNMSVSRCKITVYCIAVSIILGLFSSCLTTGEVRQYGTEANDTIVLNLTKDPNVGTLYVTHVNGEATGAVFEAGFLGFGGKDIYVNPLYVKLNGKPIVFTVSCPVVTGKDANGKPVIQYKRTELRFTKLSDIRAGDVLTLKWMYQTQAFAFMDATGNLVQQTIPQLDYIRRDWHLILNDTDKRILYLFFIPAHTIATENVTVRADKPQLIDIQINYGDDKFQDKRSGLYFYKWLKKTLRY